MPRGYQAPRSRYTTRQWAKAAAAGVSGGGGLWHIRFESLEGIYGDG
jgi:hypothetical protein